MLTAFTMDVVAPGETIEVNGPEALVLPGGRTIDIPSPEPIVGGRALVLVPSVFFKTQIIGHLSGSESHIAVGQTRVFFSAIFVLIGIIGAVVACLTKRSRRTAIFILAVALAPLILILLPYGGRAIEYLYVLSLAPMAYFGARLFEVKKRVVVPILCLLLIVSLPLHVIAHYGNQSYDYFPQSLVSGLDYSYANVATSPAISSGYPWATLEPVKHPFIPVSQLQWQEHVVLPKGGFKEDNPRWLFIHRQHEAFYSFILGAPLFIGVVEDALGNSSNCQLIYHNPDFKLYRLVPVDLP